MLSSFKSQTVDVQQVIRWTLTRGLRTYYHHHKDDTIASLPSSQADSQYNPCASCIETLDVGKVPTWHILSSSCRHGRHRHRPLLPFSAKFVKRFCSAEIKSTVLEGRRRSASWQSISLTSMRGGNVEEQFEAFITPRVQEQVIYRCIGDAANCRRR
jgi:hypothetical protein